MIAKGATVPFEDERYAYVVATRQAFVRVRLARIIKPPLEARPGVTLPLCDHDGVLKNQFCRAARQGRVSRGAQTGMG